MVKQVGEGRWERKEVKPNDDIRIVLAIVFFCLAYWIVGGSA